MKNTDRRLDLSSKFMQMGQALMEEGKETRDISISQIGTILIFLAGISFDDDDINKFSELVSMYSAKKVLENMEAEHNAFYMDVKEEADKETYEGLIEKIERLRKTNKKNNKDDKKDE
jgi:hypothetical protein